MKSLDDMFPAEQEEQQELVTLLRQVYGQPVLVTPTQQEQIIARVRKRLMQTSAADAPGEAVPSQQAAAFNTPSQAPEPFAAKPRRRRRIMHLFSTLAAVLVVGAIIGASLLLFQRHPPSGSWPVSQPIGTPVVVRAQAGGLEASMSVTPGPYFLGELLFAQLALTNSSHQTFMLEGFAASTSCNPALSVVTTDGSSPHFNASVGGFFSCPLYTSNLAPGKTITIHQYIPLTGSGNITLAFQAGFLVTKADPSGGTIYTQGSSPLDGHWPSLRINVHGSAPPNRIILLHRQGVQVTISAPSSAQHHLVYIYNVTCHDLQGPGSTGTGNPMWQPISTSVLQGPGCSGQDTQWTYAVGAPGYLIATGKYP